MKALVLLCALAAAAAAQPKLTPVDEAGYTKLIAAHKGRVVLIDFGRRGASPAARK